MRLMQLWSLVLTTCFVPLGAIAISLTQEISPTLAQAISSPGRFNLSGQWVLRTQKYRVSDNGITCIPESNSELIMEPILTQNGNQLDADPMTLIVNEGSISGNSVYLRSEIFFLTGTVSNDGNQITGTFNCQSLTQPFIMTRKGFQPTVAAPQRRQSSPSRSNPPGMLW